MPFDDFITLRNLTNNVAPIRSSAQYIANYPEHGKEVELTDGYIQSITAANDIINGITSSWKNKMDIFTENVNKLKDKFNDINYETSIEQKAITTVDDKGNTVITYYDEEVKTQKTIYTGISLSRYDYSSGLSYRQAILNIINQYVTIDGNWQTDNNAYIIAWNKIETILNKFLSEVLQIELSEFTWDDADLHIFLTNIESRYNLGHASQNASYLVEYKNKAAIEANKLNQLAASSDNVNLLWSWTNDDNGQILIETKLGISIDVQTLLNDYQPTDGLYGIRLVITGTTKPTETEMSRPITETVYFTNENMYGNTYGYYSPYTQQKILDISNFLTLTHIDCYFWQELDENKHIFRDYNGVKIPYELSPGVPVPPNIIIENLQVLLGLTAEEATEDRVLLYSYDDEEYGIAPNEIDNPVALARSDKKTLRLAWIHISEDGPVLVDHETQINNSTNDIHSLAYWNAKIYWYNYQYGIPINESNEAEKYGGLSWKPKPFDQEGIVDTFAYSDNKANYSLDVIPSRDKIREKYRALVLTNNTPIRSNILQFTNRDVNVAASFESLYDIVFRFLKGTVSDQGTQMKIVQDNSIGNFFVYDENNDIISDEHGVPYSDMPYYVQIWIRNNETGDYSPATLDPDNGIEEVIWDPLGNLSMITEFTEPSDSELENTELTPLTGDMNDEQRRLLKLITRRFKINPKLVMSYTQNFIRATVVRNNKLYSVQKELVFGQSGSMGSPYTIVLQQTKPENGEMIQNSEFEITAHIFERGVERPNVRYNFQWIILSPTVITKRLEDAISGYIDEYDHEQQGKIDGQKIGEWWHSELNYSDRGGYVNNVISGYIRNDMPLIIKCICKHCADYDISTVAGYGLVNNNPIIFNNNLQVQCPDRVEYKSDGSAPIADMGDFFVKKKKVSAQNQRAIDCGYLFQDKYDDENEDYDELYPDEIYPEWKLFSYIIKYIPNTETNEDGEEVETGIKEGYLSGGNNTLYNSLSLQSREETNTLITELEEDIEIPKHYIYRLDTTIDYSINGNRKIHGNSEAPANWYWDNSYETNYYVVLQWQKTLTVTNIINGNPITESVDYWFKQAVPLTLNVYSSSLVNTWNGELLIDSENNAILAKMIAAGSKNKNNQFTGVMMGDWKTKGDDSLETPGMYGFTNGRQTFGFRTDGTGFIGTSGKGQIQFDGNKALISNADKTCYINLDPIQYNYKGSDIRIKNYRGYSQYFLWAESEATTKTHGDKKSDYTWANKLFEAVNDTNRDLFVVDPNNGILTTGGIYAKYGRLGKYLLLNDSGLIYKQYLNDKNEYIINENLPNNENNDIIYIGQERKRNGALIPLDEIQRDYDHYYWSSKSYNNPGRIGREQADLSKDVGRYVIWVGNKCGAHAYPKFGVEHDGTVHLTEAYVEGVIHASTLVIGNEDVSEYERNRGQKTFYTKIQQSSDAIGANPALLKEEPTDPNIPKWLWGGYNKGANAGTCKNNYGDWLRPGDIWYIESDIATKVINFKGTGEVDNPNFTNLYKLREGQKEFTPYIIKFNDDEFLYSDSDPYYENINNDTSKHIIYRGSTDLNYINYSFDGTKYNDNTIFNDQYIVDIDVYNNQPYTISSSADLSFRYIDITALEDKLNKISKKLTLWTEQYLNEAKIKYDQNPTDINLLNTYNQAMNGALDIQSYYDTYSSMYNAIYSKLEDWATNLNIDTNDSALAKTSYSMSSLILDKLNNQTVDIDENKENNIKISIQEPPEIDEQLELELEELDINLTDTENSILEEETFEIPQTSYTEFIWEGILNDDGTSSTNQNVEDNHDWFGIWSESNVLPNGAQINERITIDQLNNNPGEANGSAPGYIHPKYRTASTKSGTTVRWYDAPPGWRRVGVVDSESIWDALKHSTFTFNAALQSTTFQLTNNLNSYLETIMNQMQLSKKEALEELVRQRKELTNMLGNLQKKINTTVFESAAAIRNGMDPISFFGDGNCYVFVTNHLYESNISGIGQVPAGITIAQLPNQDSNDKYGSVFYLNSKRMGFYRSYNETLNGQTIKCNIPLLAYYNGAMALAGSMFLGLDYNNYIKQQGLNIELDDEDNIPISTVASSSPGASNYNPQYDNISLYKNYIDGPNCRIVLGNGTIVIDGLDNGLDIEGRSGNYPFPNALRTGKQEGGTPFVYIGANPNTSDGDTYKSGVVRIGAKNAGIGKLSLADFELASTSYDNTISSIPIITNENVNLDPMGYTYKFTQVGEIPSLGLKTKQDNDKEISITYINECNFDNDNKVSISTATVNITVDTYEKNYGENWPPKIDNKVNFGVLEEQYFCSTVGLEYSTNDIQLNGDILSIVQQANNKKYTGLGIIANNSDSKNTSKVILGPIRYMEKITSDKAIDIRGYKDAELDRDNGCWLVGWNFYGLNVFSRNIYNAGNIIIEKNIFKWHKMPKNSGLESRYVKILDEIEVFNLINDSETRLAGMLNSNLLRINNSLVNIYDSLNNHSEAFISIADILKALADSTRSLANGVNKALGASEANKNGIGNALNAANEALAKSLTKVIFTSTQAQSTNTRGCQQLAPEFYTNPFLNKGAGEKNEELSNAVVDFVNASHTHDIEMIYSDKENQLQLRSKNVDSYLSDSGDAYSDFYDFDLTNSLDDRYVLPGDLALGMAWLESTGSSVKGTLSLKSGNTNKVKFNLNNDDTGLHIDFVSIIKDVIDEYSYKQETIDQKVLEAFKKGWEDGWTADYLAANELKVGEIGKPNQFYVQLKRLKYDGPGVDKLEILEKQGSSQLGTLMSFELKFDNDNKQSQVYLHTSNLGGNAEYSAEILANDGMYAYKEGIKEAINQGDVLYWFVDESNKRIGVQWYYTNNLLNSTDEDYKKISEIKYTYLEPTIDIKAIIDNYNSSNIEFRIVPQITGYVYDSEEKKLINKTIDFGNYKNNYITLSANQPYEQGYAEGLKDTINNGQQIWFYNKQNGLGVQWYYTNKYLDPKDENYKKTSEVKYNYLSVNVVDYKAIYSEEYRTYTISYTPQFSTSVYNPTTKREEWQHFTFDTITQTIYTNRAGEAYTDGWNHGYDDGYIAGWQKAVNNLEAKLTHAGGNDASGNVIATASIKNDSFLKKVDNQSQTLSGGSDTDSAYLSFSKGSEGTAHWGSKGQIDTVEGQSFTPSHTATYYRDISAWIEDHEYGSLTWS